MNAIIATGRKLVNALAFANVNSLNELRRTLNQIDVPADSPGVPSQHNVIFPESSRSTFMPAMGHIQEAR